MTIHKHIDFEVPLWGEFASPPKVSHGFASYVASLSPEHWYRCSDTGTVLGDSVGSLDGVWNVSQLFVSGLVAFDSNGAADTQGTNYAVIGDAGDLDYNPAQDDLVIFVLISSTEDKPASRRILSRRDATKRQYEIFFDASDIWFGSGNRYIHTSHAGLFNGEVHSLALRWFDDAGTRTARAYIDGQIIGSVTGMVSMTGISATHLVSAAHLPGTLITDTRVDELLFIPNALSDQAIQNIHNLAVGGLITL